MKYQRIKPCEKLAGIVGWYWQAESEDATSQVQKIIPDGYPEMVFHFGDPFRIRLGNHWQQQGQALLGGQIQHHFHLQNTGVANIFGISFHPTALSRLFGLDMQQITNRVVDIEEVLPKLQLVRGIMSAGSTQARIAAAETSLLSILSGATADHPIDRALQIMRDRKGLISMEELSESIQLGSRQMQRLFQKYVGVTPKFYARVIRFNTLFDLVKEEGTTWLDMVHASGYYDQSHFIRNFKAFTGEDPTTYSFASPSLTNFFAFKSSVA
ncbi:MAG: AraC family transcriptional regulator [Cyclobacteriaceae bacterium]|nr:AraC family transcriptional regulator [Cyclobacteriaceae bacterium]